LPDIENSISIVQTAPKVVCPTCGAHDGYKTGITLGGSFSWVAFLLGGFIAVFFRNFSRQRRVQCNACGTFFGIRTPLSKLSLVAYWLLIGPTIVLLLFVLLGLLLK
jgi:chromate transport protein ChrA